MLFTLLAGSVSWAQVVDDVYYNPEKDRVLIQKQRPAKESNAYYEEGRYDDDNYSAGYEDEYDYYMALGFSTRCMWMPRTTTPSLVLG